MRKQIEKKPDLNSKAGKYLIKRAQGLNKSDSARAIGLDPRDTTRLEKSKTFEVLQKTYFRDELLQKIALADIAQALAENITQDKDRGARNTAINIALERIEPETNPIEEERVLVVLR